MEEGILEEECPSQSRLSRGKGGGGGLVLGKFQLGKCQHRQMQRAHARTHGDPEGLHRQPFTLGVTGCHDRVLSRG